MHFSAKCNSGRIAIQWFHIKHYLDYQYTKIPALYLSGAKYVCFCTIRDFGSPTTYYSNYKYGYTFILIYLTFICKKPFPAVLYFCLTFILLDNFACSFDLLIFFKITLLLKQILSLIASVSKTKYEFRSLIEYK